MDPQHLRISCPPFGSSANFIASGMRTLDIVFENLLGPSRKKTIE
jgi:hypothetical protein